MRSSSRRNTYDFLRLLAALAVVVQHATVHLDARFLWLQPGGDWWFYDGVTAFFIISGLFVFRSADNLRRRGAPWLDFYVNRALRIVPALWAYLAVTVVLVLALGAATVGQLVSVPGLAWIASTLGLVPVYSPGFLSDFGVGSINGSLWTIPVEVSFYVIVPTLVIAQWRMGRRWFYPVLLSGAAVLAVVQVVLGDSGLVGKLYGITFLPHLWAFALGIGWYLFRDRIQPSWRLSAFALLSYLALTALGHAGIAPQLMTLLAAAPLSCLVVHVGEQGPLAFRRFTERVGDLSFGTYIWHMVVVNAFLWLGVTAGMPGTVAVALVLVTSLVLAWLSWHLVEHHALARKRVSSREQTAGGDVSAMPARSRAAS